MLCSPFRTSNIGSVYLYCTVLYCTVLYLECGQAEADQVGGAGVAPVGGEAAEAVPQAGAGARAGLRVLPPGHGNTFSGHADI